MGSTEFVDTETIYTDIAHEMINRYSRLLEPGDRRITAAFKSRIMGTPKAIVKTMMIQEYQLEIDEDEYDHVMDPLEV